MKFNLNQTQMWINMYRCCPIRIPHSELLSVPHPLPPLRPPDGMGPMMGGPPGGPQRGERSKGPNQNFNGPPNQNFGGARGGNGGGPNNMGGGGQRQPMQGGGGPMGG